MYLTRSLATAANRVPSRAFFGGSVYSGMFDGFTVRGKNAKLDVRAIMVMWFWKGGCV